VSDTVDSIARTVSAWQAEEALKVLRVVLNRAVASEIIPRNVAARVHTPTPEREPLRILDAASLTKVVAHLPARYKAFALLDAFAALRWSEVVAIKRDDLDLHERTVRIDEACVEVGGRLEWGPPKTLAARRTVDLPDSLVPILAEHLLRFPPMHDIEDDRFNGLVFYGERGTRRTSQPHAVVRRHVFRSIWRDACDAAGVEYMRPGLLRHVGASISYSATRDLKGVSQRLGHKTTRMLDSVYLTLYSADRRRLADALDPYVAGALR
jgi:integrase